VVAVGFEVADQPRDIAGLGRRRREQPGRAELQQGPAAALVPRLGRAADPAGLGNAVAALMSGVTPGQLAAALCASPEYDTRIVEADYHLTRPRRRRRRVEGVRLGDEGRWSEQRAAETFLDSAE
jgi:hypothetical protein